MLKLNESLKWADHFSGGSLILVGPNTVFTSSPFVRYTAAPQIPWLELYGKTNGSTRLLAFEKRWSYTNGDLVRLYCGHLEITLDGSPKHYNADWQYHAVSEATSARLQEMIEETRELSRGNTRKSTSGLRFLPFTPGDLEHMEDEWKVILHPFTPREVGFTNDDLWTIFRHGTQKVLVRTNPKTGHPEMAPEGHHATHMPQM